jgi:pseudaminic acid biosynthesis-associated methylase
VEQAAAVFQRIVETASVRGDVGTILEVGANVGINLKGLRLALGPGVMLGALEPNPTACAQLRADAEIAATTVIEGDAYTIPLRDDAYDLVFTSGVLIHVPPARLPEAMREIRRVARRYVLCIEYFSHLPVEVPYHGQGGLLWKRDFGRAYQEQCPTLEVVQYGFLWQQEFPHFDDLNWWMFRKRGA